MSYTNPNGKTWETTDDGDLVDDGVRLEMGLVGPTWSPVMRFRFYVPTLHHEDHITIWKVRWLSRWLGSYTPPGWFLRLVGEVKK